MSKKELYLVPETEVLELRLEGVIALSYGDDPVNYNSPFGEEEGI